MGKGRQAKTIPFLYPAWPYWVLQSKQTRFRLVKNGDGYLYVKYWEHPNHDSRGRILHHRLVIEEYLGRYLNTNEIVHHINGNKIDNRIENLKIVTISEHRKIHSIDNLYKKGYREFENQIEEIIRLRKSGLFAYEIAKQLGISRRTISRYLQQNDLGRKIGMKIRKRNKLGKFI